MAKTVLGEYTLVQNGNPLDTTAVAVDSFVTPAKLSLSVSAAAETLEGESDRAHPAQMVVKLAIDTLKQSTSDDPHVLILEAFRAANRVLYDLGRNIHEKLSCSMALALIVDDHMLYMGNLGATRIYLYDPQAGLQQLSVEHTFAQIMTQQRQMTYENAIAHPKATSILRSLGINEDVEADTGLYGLSGTAENGEQFGLRGFPIQPGEAVIVCSSEFYKTSTLTSEPFITEAEIIRALESRSGMDAARMMVENAIPRQPEDFIAAAVLQLPSRRQSSRVARPSSQGMILWLVVLVMLVGFGALFLIPRLAQPPEVPTPTVVQQVALLSTSVTESATPPPPTATPVPTQVLPPPTQAAIGEILPLAYSGSNPNPLLQGHVIDAPANTGLRVDIPNRNEAVESAQLYMQPLTHVQIDQVSESQVSATLFEGGDIFINSGGYRDGVIVRLSGAENVSFAVSGSYMSVQYSPNMITVTCFEGNCTYTIDGPPPSIQTIPVGQTAYISGDEISFEPVTGDQVEHYRSLANTNGASQDVNAFLDSYVSPTPVPTDDVQNTEAVTSEATATSSETNTRVAPSKTPTGTLTPSITPTPTYTPTTQQTGTGANSKTTAPGTLTRTPTRTPQPSSTFTSQPPTSTWTDVPPTDTDTNVPPTDTDVPPTDTPTNPPVPTDTDVPPTDTQAPPPTDTQAPPPTDTQAPPPTDVPPAGTQGS